MGKPGFLSCKGIEHIVTHIGQVTFGKNLTEWVAKSTKQLDYWITAGDTPSEIEEAYAGATGTVPMMPEYGMGFWQCKLRYQTQEELLSVAREYKKRGLPISVIVDSGINTVTSARVCSRGCILLYPLHDFQGSLNFVPAFVGSQQLPVTTIVLSGAYI